MTKSVTFNHMVEFMEKGKIVYGHLNVRDFTWAPLPREQIKILHINLRLYIRPRDLIWTR